MTQPKTETSNPVSAPAEDTQAPAAPAKDQPSHDKGEERKA